MSKFLYWLTGFLPARYINDGETRYLERFYLFTLFGWRFYLHRFVGSDPDRGLHDHPWRRAFSIILAGWYWEETRMGTRKVRWFNSLTGDTFHRVVLPEVWEHGVDVEPCWTLFFHKVGNVKPWGFWRPLKGVNISGMTIFKIDDGIHVFEPYTYTREGNQRNWWKTAPTGRELRDAVVRKAGDA